MRAFEEEDTSTCDSTCQKLVGIAFVLVGEFFHGCQFVYEEKYVVAYDLHPLKVVGYEGDNYYAFWLSQKLEEWKSHSVCQSVRLKTNLLILHQTET